MISLALPPPPPVTAIAQVHTRCGYGYSGEMVTPDNQAFGFGCSVPGPAPGEYTLIKPTPWRGDGTYQAVPDQPAGIW